ncbi:DUF6660 family protein [Parapedobacter pyrenivorans]|uniref:DUF6660 family protein n=1 Tax=Parapedobacter pyrenivorans TaxID=1305674 RepID=UPI00333FC9EF
MKWFAMILAILLTVLFVMPCTDGDNRCQDESATQTTDQMTHDHGKDKDDGCSPFCLCACCSIAVAAFHFHQPKLGNLIPKPILREAVIRNDYFVSNYLGNIWQPPKSIS